MIHPVHSLSAVHRLSSGAFRQQSVARSSLMWWSSTPVSLSLPPPTAPEESSILQEEGTVKIELCMGSSCFARGNAEVLKVLEQRLASETFEGIELSGHPCLGQCSCGPNIRVDGKLYQGLTVEELLALIESGGE